MINIVISTDARHGGRWTSLRVGGREWLWSNPDPDVRRARSAAAPGAPFVDAGGVEECFPTVRGDPDHGAVWSRPWSTDATDRPGAGAAAAVQRCRVGALGLQRTITVAAASAVIDYRIDGPAGARFVHAVHALLDLGPDARITVDGRPPMQVLDHPTVRRASWPLVGDVDVSGVAPSGRRSGGAYAMIIDCARVLVDDGADRLQLDWRVVDADLPVSLLYWRNLWGWPASAPYRSIGIEPMIGRTADPAAEPDRAAVLGESGSVRWQLVISAGD